MKLISWLWLNKVEPDDFGKKIGVSERSVYRYLRGEREPSLDVMVKIMKQTKGEVTRNDFYEDAVARMDRLKRGKKMRLVVKGGI